VRAGIKNLLFLIFFYFAMRDERLAAMERTISKLPSDLEYPDILHHVADERAQWTPYLTALGRRFDDAKAKAKAGDMSAMDQYTQMNATGRRGGTLGKLR
jgi:hypothetical protein